MDNDSMQLGWKWAEVEDTSEWEIPDGPVMRLIFSLGGDPSMKVYDLGCGIGRHTVFFSAQGYQVSASDISEEAIKKTREWLKKAGLSADVQQGKMTEIKQPDNTFDLVISINTIYHAFKRDVVKAVSEVYRILKPGGLFHGTLKTKDRDAPFTDENNVIVDEQTIILKGGVEDGIPHFFSYKEDLLEFFKDFEFDNIVYFELFSPPYTRESFLAREGSGYFRFSVRKPR
ncbi:MAG: class I SAM-dependent methyltransferase [Candidatus Odinarchaeota archaeon]